ncbi:hypothetical protein DCC85_18300 [Paenibacillus sp. CAA11]|uniref:hypothetical protein n=1 Tax=Paenibacillus sp. CAA11 TaxID=1532905 RepID=UPI000D349051|nr:hypothetical protein [Paenibacillus sp. CAA11]AWB45948.1 hypothetical protein DCC85_18300 [Paenibacillus sp. CAA11]
MNTGVSRKLRWFVLLALAFLLSFSAALPVNSIPYLPQESSDGLFEQEAAELEHKYRTPVRQALHSSVSTPCIRLTTFIIFLLTMLGSFLLPQQRNIFTPTISRRLKQVLLHPIKFTSHFVA